MKLLYLTLIFGFLAFISAAPFTEENTSLQEDAKLTDDRNNDNQDEVDSDDKTDEGNEEDPAELSKIADPQFGDSVEDEGEADAYYKVRRSYKQRRIYLPRRKYLHGQRHKHYGRVQRRVWTRRFGGKYYRRRHFYKDNEEDPIEFSDIADPENQEDVVNEDEADAFYQARRRYLPRRKHLHGQWHRHNERVQRRGWTRQSGRKYYKRRHYYQDNEEDRTELSEKADSENKESATNEYEADAYYKARRYKHRQGYLPRRTYLYRERHAHYGRGQRRVWARRFGGKYYRQRHFYKDSEEDRAQISAKSDSGNEEPEVSEDEADAYYKARGRYKHQRRYAPRRYAYRGRHQQYRRVRRRFGGKYYRRRYIY